MCEKTASGTIPTPADQNIKSTIADCQRSGVFVNGTNRVAYIVSSGTRYVLPVGKALTVPVGSFVNVYAQGDGVVVWTLTSAALPAQVSDAPEIERDLSAPEPSELTTFKNNGQGIDLTLSSPAYSKLVFMAVIL